MSSPPSPSVLTTTNTAVWQWTGSAKRHEIRFEHNTVSGKQSLWVDGAEHFRSGWKFKLTGTMCLTLEDRLLEIHLLCDEWGSLYYRLTLNGTLVPLAGGNVLAQEQAAAAAAAAPSARSPGGGGSGRALSSPASPSAGAATRWRVRGSTVEFAHAESLVLVDGAVQACEGAFVEEEPDVVDGRHGEVASGVRFVFPVAGAEAELTVLPSIAGRGPPTCVLRIQNVVVAPRASAL